MDADSDKPREAELRRRLDELTRGLEARQAQDNAESRAQAAQDGSMAEAGRAMSLGFRAITELVVGLGVGTAVGWGIDRLTGTLPLFMILFLFLGMAAGVWNVMRLAKTMNSAGVRTSPSQASPPADDPGAKRPPEAG
jgi:ATP synthase protein I